VRTEDKIGTGSESYPVGGFGI